MRKGAKEKIAINCDSPAILTPEAIKAIETIIPKTVKNSNIEICVKFDSITGKLVVEKIERTLIYKTYIKQ